MKIFIRCFFAVVVGLLFTSCSVQRRVAYADWSGQNLRHLSIALSQYAQDHSGILPPLNDVHTMQKCLYPYLGNSAAYTDPETKKFYRANLSLSQKNLKRIASPGTVIAFYQDQATKDGLYQVVFLDQTVSYVSSKDLQQEQHFYVNSK